MSSLRSFLLRKMYWINDALHGAPMGKEFHAVSRILNNKEATFEALLRAKKDEKHE